MPILEGILKDRKFPFALVNSNSKNSKKTEFCVHHGTGQCTYGDRCKFVHNVFELQPRQFSSQWKTQKCESFDPSGKTQCKFGSRCRFIHDDQYVLVSDSLAMIISYEDQVIRFESCLSKLRQSEISKLVSYTDPKVIQTAFIIYQSLFFRTNEIL
jgi:hypothetical protein